MAWTTPKTWTDGVLVNGGHLNEQIRDNLTAIGPGHQVLTTSQKNALVGVVTGTMVYDSTLGLLQFWNGSAWVPATGLVFLSSWDFPTLASSIIIDNIFSSTFTNYKIVTSLWNSSSSTCNAYFQFRASGTTDASAIYTGVANQQSQLGTINLLNWGHSKTRGAPAAGCSATLSGPFSPCVSDVNVYSPFAADVTRVDYSGVAESTVAPSFDRHYGWGAARSNTSYTGLTITAALGNVNGSVKVYGYVGH